jgi:hypothetical protein
LAGAIEASRGVHTPDAAGGTRVGKSSGLVAAGDAAASVLLLPLSLLQHGLYLAGLGSAHGSTAAPAGLGATPAQAATPGSAGRYGMGLGAWLPPLRLSAIPSGS